MWKQKIVSFFDEKSLTLHVKNLTSSVALTSVVIAVCVRAGLLKPDLISDSLLVVGPLCLLYSGWRLRGRWERRVVERSLEHGWDALQTWSDAWAKSRFMLKTKLDSVELTESRSRVRVTFEVWEE